MDLTSTVALEELVLLVAAVIGVWRHWRALRALQGRCSHGLTASETILCRQYLRHERVRWAIKALLVYAAFWLMVQPSDQNMAGWEWWGRLAFKLAPVAIAVALDWESYRSGRDQSELAALGSMPHEHEAGK